MKSIKKLKIILFAFMLFIGFSAVAPSTIANASTNSVTIETKYINQYTPAKRVCGYVKDASGNPVANTTVYISRYDSFIHSSEKHKVIKPDEIYTEVKTDANGYYSLFAYDSGYYYAFLPSRTISTSEFEDFYFNGGTWPSRFVLDLDNLYACDTYASTYALVRK